VIADLQESDRQDVPEEAAQELHRVWGNPPTSIRPHAAVGEGYLGVVAGGDPMVADGDAEVVEGDVAERLAAVTGGLSVDCPVAPPHRRVDLIEPPLIL
jgi:hypothetical protein